MSEPFFSSSEKPNVPIGIVIFGATGDLTRRKLLPALYQLAAEDQLPDKVHIIGFARREWDDAKFQAMMLAGIEEFAREQPVDPQVMERLLPCLHYVASVFEAEKGYQELSQLLDNLGADNRLFYLATPPSAYSEIIDQIGAAGLANCEMGWTRIVVEKPYGQDLSSAQQLDQQVHQVFSEDQIYRIDHYLGKETVQNILVFRFANGIFEPLWNRRYIDSVQITVAESVGVGTRAGYYEGAGVLRDMLQNHLLQLLTLTAMESPATFTADAVRDEKVKVLNSLDPLIGDDALANTFRAQYKSGTHNGVAMPAYLNSEGVAKNSKTETLLAAKLQIANWRWAGVPFFLRSGKALARRVTEIAVQFKQVPLSLFGWKNLAGEAPNILIMRLQPDEGISLRFGAKVPGAENRIEAVQMNFSYEETFGNQSPAAYERLLMDSMNGDATLFTRSDEVLSAWQFVSNITEVWQAAPATKLPQYEVGSWGPPELDSFIQRSGLRWRNPKN